MRKPEWILCAAVWVNTGKEEPGGWSYGRPPTGLVFSGLRHGDCIALAYAWWAELSPVDRAIAEEANGGRNYGNLDHQGFLTSRGRWVNRKEAQVIAKARGQVDEKFLRGDKLYSEDLY